MKLTQLQEAQYGDHPAVKFIKSVPEESDDWTQFPYSEITHVAEVITNTFGDPEHEPRRSSFGGHYWREWSWKIDTENGGHILVFLSPQKKKKGPNKPLVAKLGVEHYAPDMDILEAKYYRVDDKFVCLDCAGSGETDEVFVSPLTGASQRKGCKTCDGKGYLTQNTIDRMRNPPSKLIRLKEAKYHIDHPILQKVYEFFDILYYNKPAQERATPYRNRHKEWRFDRDNAQGAIQALEGEFGETTFNQKNDGGETWEWRTEWRPAGETRDETDYFIVSVSIPKEHAGGFRMQSDLRAYLLVEAED
jgi:hypothetical protein